MAVVAVCFFTTACDTAAPPEVKRSVNYSDDFMYRQMVASLNAFPSDKNIDSYTHFHPSEAIEDRIRMTINISDILSNTDVKYLSIGCDTVSVCGDILVSALEYSAMRKLYRNDMTLMLPEYLEAPHEVLDKLGISTLVYKVPNLKSSDVLD